MVRVTAMSHRLLFTLALYPQGLLSCRMMRKLACAIFTSTMLLAGPALAKPSLFLPDSAVQQTCIACHAAEPGGAITRIETMRATPEEWDLILTRMERRYGVGLDPQTRKDALKELTKYLGLSPEEQARVAYLTRSVAASFKEELPNDDEVQRVCSSCHTWGKVLSTRRTPESWKSLKDFHLASFPAATILSYEDMKWRLEADKMLDKLARWLPFEAPGWRNGLKAKAPDLSGQYLASGRQVGKGEYQATVTLKARPGGEYAATKAILWDDGSKESWTGAGALYGNHALRLRWNWPGSHVKESLAVAPDGSLEGTWTVKHYEHLFGDETLLPVKKGPQVARVAPTWITPGGIHKVRVLSTGKLGALSFGPGTQVVASRPLSDGWTEVTVKVAPNAAPALNPVAQGGKPSRVKIGVAPRVDYIRVTPDHGMARTGYEWNPDRPAHVPLQGVPFEAFGWSVGRDGKRDTADDVLLGLLKGVDWALEEFHTTSDDHDIDYIGRLQPGGMFMPSGFGPNPDSPSKNNTGNAWVVARWRPGPAADPLRARAYLWVTFPDIVKGIL